MPDNRIFEHILLLKTDNKLHGLVWLGFAIIIPVLTQCLAYGKYLHLKKTGKEKER